MFPKVETLGYVKKQECQNMANGFNPCFTKYIKYSLSFRLKGEIALVTIKLIKLFLRNPACDFSFVEMTNSGEAVTKTKMNLHHLYGLKITYMVQNFKNKLLC